MCPHFRDPTHKDDLIADYHPIQNNEIMMIDINNNGLTVIGDPRKESMEFWTNLEKRANQLKGENQLIHCLMNKTEELVVGDATVCK